ncbi:hypothetical protein J6590_014439 [Homalodisca vitripennis]|nr:hypothetical protein J6590_014439 [Homalodisca vitripennis]
MEETKCTRGSRSLSVSLSRCGQCILADRYRTHDIKDRGANDKHKEKARTSLLDYTRTITRNIEEASQVGFAMSIKTSKTGEQKTNTRKRREHRCLITRAR